MIGRYVARDPDTVLWLVNMGELLSILLHLLYTVILRVFDNVLQTVGIMIIFINSKFCLYCEYKLSYTILWIYFNSDVYAR